MNIKSTEACNLRVRVLMEKFYYYAALYTGLTYKKIFKQTNIFKPSKQLTTSFR
jgi:hypothetical protein